MTDTPECMCEAAFDFSSEASSVLLRQGQATLQIDGNTFEGQGEARLDLLPKPKVNLYGQFPNLSTNDVFVAMTVQNPPLAFSFDGRPIEGFLVDFDTQSGQPVVKWSPKSEPIIGIGDASTQMERVVFHIFNFVLLEGMTQCPGPDETGTRYIDLECDDWKVRFKSLPDTRDNFKKLKAEGGYQLTYVGCLEKSDGSTFSDAEAADCLNALRLFLSFAKGGWCAPHCAVGYDATGARVWESWSSPKESWRTPLSWFDPHHCEQLRELFPRFMTRRKVADWRDALREAIYWYLLANDSSHGIDAGIILTQAAIERLAYELVINDRRLLTAEGFKKLRASDKFRLLFSTLCIPLDIPVETPGLQAMAQQRKGLDAPHALTEIRNAVVHPEHRHRNQFGALHCEAWNLGLWFLEMSVLAICDYVGTYGSRLNQQRWVGQIEDVPW